MEHTKTDIVATQRRMICRDDFGPSLRGKSCSTCGKWICNRGCFLCGARLCKEHFAQHICPATFQSGSFPRQPGAWEQDRESLIKEVARLRQEVSQLAQVKQEVAQLHEAWARGEKNVQQEYAGMKQDLDKMYMMMKKDGEDFVKRKEFVAATQLVNQEHLKKTIEDVVNSEKHDRSNPMPECPPTRPESPPTRPNQQNEFDSPRQYRVVHSDLVYVREDPSSDSPVLGYKSHGDVVLATSEANDWLKLSDQNGWLLRDGQTLGLGVLLEDDME
jgi:hypothetical protein